ncbi:GTP cyclohydrolase 1 type 2/Nif3 [Filobasidium floriforme]|uniref:GTP cyclohydrolase 1 type 2/Nif3 n=1 Tax=Filobasidium floriforme TaxID=5210 RepID=UPI001E8E701D|nr:GTP cyclohydrolase 1 type 2/Nif3 [Filobasidium floriforme]KAH8080065.1 GTP cyclohydrolase 1 type 2/Nif3 [Filobasidium floriforme]
MSVVQKTPINILQQAWKRIAPLELADNSWDNAPFPKNNAKKVLLTIDLTTDVCNEALDLEGCSVVVAYHPPVRPEFRSLSLKLSNTLQASLLKLSAKGISVFSPHTSLDSIEGGINSWLTTAFGTNLKSSTPLEPKFSSGSSVPAHLAGFEGAGMGRFVELHEGVEAGEAVRRIKGLLKLERVQYGAPAQGSIIKTVAICAGSGGSMFKDVKADLYWTGEMGHHQALATTQAGSHVVLCHHTNTERGYLSAVLKDKLREELNAQEGQDGWEVVVSGKDKDPLLIV